MKGLFIPEMTVEKFRDKCFESIEALIADDEIFNIDYDPRHIPAIRDKLWEIQQCSNCVLKPEKITVEIRLQWIPAMEGLPKKNGPYIVTCIEKGERRTDWNIWVKDHWFYREDEPIAWMSLPKPFDDYREEENLSPYDINQFLSTINESLCSSYYIPLVAKMEVNE